MRAAGYKLLKKWFTSPWGACWYQQAYSSLLTSFSRGTSSSICSKATTPRTSLCFLIESTRCRASGSTFPYSSRPEPFLLFSSYWPGMVGLTRRNSVPGAARRSGADAEASGACASRGVPCRRRAMGRAPPRRRPRRRSAKAGLASCFCRGRPPRARGAKASRRRLGPAHSPGKCFSQFW